MRNSGVGSSAGKGQQVALLLQEPPRCGPERQQGAGNGERGNGERGNGDPLDCILHRPGTERGTGKKRDPPGGARGISQAACCTGSLKTGAKEKSICQDLFLWLLISFSEKESVKYYESFKTADCMPNSLAKPTTIRQFSKFSLFSNNLTKQNMTNKDPREINPNK